MSIMSFLDLVFADFLNKLNRSCIPSQDNDCGTSWATTCYYPDHPQFQAVVCHGHDCEIIYAAAKALHSPRTLGALPQIGDKVKVFSRSQNEWLEGPAEYAHFFKWFSGVKLGAGFVVLGDLFRCTQMGHSAEWTPGSHTQLPRTCHTCWLQQPRTNWCESPKHLTNTRVPVRTARIWMISIELEGVATWHRCCPRRLWTWGWVSGAVEKRAVARPGWSYKLSSRWAIDRVRECGSSECPFRKPWFWMLGQRHLTLRAIIWALPSKSPAAGCFGWSRKYP